MICLLRIRPVSELLIPLPIDFGFAFLKTTQQAWAERKRSAQSFCRADGGLPVLHSFRHRGNRARAKEVEQARVQLPDLHY